MLSPSSAYSRLTPYSFPLSLLSTRYVDAVNFKRTQTAALAGHDRRLQKLLSRLDGQEYLRELSDKAGVGIEKGSWKPNTHAEL